MRLFFGSFPGSSFSLSLASRFAPTTDTFAVELLGVSGGVVMGTPVTFAEFAAVIPGTAPAIRVAL